MHEPQYVVTAYYSNTYYSFLLDSYIEAQKFEYHIYHTRNDVEGVTLHILNDPSTFNTGQEVAI